MDEFNPKKLVAMGALLVGFVVLLMMSRKQSDMHRENIEDVRMTLVMRGCAMGGVEPATPAMSACEKAAGPVCKSRNGHAVEECARRVAEGH